MPHMVDVFPVPGGLGSKSIRVRNKLRNEYTLEPEKIHQPASTLGSQSPEARSHDKPSWLARPALPADEGLLLVVASLSGDKSHNTGAP